MTIRDILNKSTNEDIARFMMKTLCSGECCMCPIYDYEISRGDECVGALVKILESDEKSENAIYFLWD